MTGVRAIVALVAFLLELAALAALARFGWRTGSGPATRVLLAVLAPGVWALVWGLLFSPHPAVPLPSTAALAGRLAMFAVAALALAATGHPALAALGAAAALVVQLAARDGEAHSGSHPAEGETTGGATRGR